MNRRAFLLAGAAAAVTPYRSPESSGGELIYTRWVSSWKTDPEHMLRHAVSGSYLRALPGSITVYLV